MQLPAFTIDHQMPQIDNTKQVNPLLTYQMVNQAKLYKQVKLYLEGFSWGLAGGASLVLSPWFPPPGFSLGSPAGMSSLRRSGRLGPCGSSAGCKQQHDMDSDCSTLHDC
jgi:hypothetical protein